jgi:hypothetical protein
MQAQEGLHGRLEQMNVQHTHSHGGVYHPSPAFGDVSIAVGYVAQLRDAGADETMFLVQMGAVPQGVRMETIRLLGEEVIPRFRPSGASR